MYGSVLVETRYIDADWRSEHASFYSTTYVRYPSVAHRANFFSEPLPSDLGDLAALQSACRGYVVLRPLKSSPVGRAMITPPPESSRAVAGRAATKLVDRTTAQDCRECSRSEIYRTWA